MVMDRMDTTFFNYLANKGQFGAKEMSKLISTVHQLHELNIAHGDLKPSNILMKNGKFYIADFGLSENALKLNKLAKKIEYIFDYLYLFLTTKRIITDMGTLATFRAHIIDEIRDEFPERENDARILSGLDELLKQYDQRIMDEKEINYITYYGIESDSDDYKKLQFFGI